MSDSLIEVWIQIEHLEDFSMGKLVEIFNTPSPTRSKVLLSADKFQKYMEYTRSKISAGSSISEKRLLKD